MRLVVDASAGVRQVLSRRRPRLLVHSSLDLLITEHCLVEALRNLHARIDGQAAAGVVDARAAAVLHAEGEGALRAAVEVMPEAVYAPYQAEAAQRLEFHCAFADWPSVALALVLGRESDGIWTDDRDYFGSGVATWTTDALRRVTFGEFWEPRGTEEPRELS